ncbi:hypothetical protein GCM10009429_25690 [Dyella marensis]
MPNPLLEVDKFKAWAGTYPSTERYGEWECDYTEWPALHAAVLEFVASRPFDHWQRGEQTQVLYAIARDNEIEYLAEEIRTRHPELLLSLAQASLEIDERDARWQLAVQLAWLGVQAEPLLLKMADDEHEYVRRRALQSLLRIDSPSVEKFALAAWHRPDEAQQWARMNALYCLQGIGSSQLPALLAEAEKDARPYLREYASRILRGECLD